MPGARAGRDALGVGAERHPTSGLQKRDHFRRGPAHPALEGLAGFAPGDFGGGLAHRLRALWRIESGNAGRAAEAIAILDRILTRQRSPEHYFQRLRAAANARDEAKVWAGLYHFLSSRRVSRAHTPKQLLQIARQIGGAPPPEWAMVPGQLEDAMSANRARRR